jgi:hypothetical protein
VKKVFADAAYFIALLNPADNFHARAVELARLPPGPIITTYWILAEVGDAFSQPGNRSKFARLIALTAATPDIENIDANDRAISRGGFNPCEPRG